MRKLMVGALALAVALTVSGCSHPVTTQSDAVARIDSGTALNARPGTYQVADVKVTLVKVVPLPGDDLGLRFSFASDSPSCCSLFPRLALAPGPSGESAVPSTSVVVPRSDVRPDGTLQMRLSENGRTTVPFTIDFRKLGAQLP